MRCVGPHRTRRHLLFAEEGVGGLWTTETGEPLVIRGRDRLAEHAAWLTKCFPDWRYFNIEVFDTQHPDQFWVECDGEGTMLLEGYPEGHYSNHFLHSFVISGGLITRHREFANPCRLFHALGIDVPTIRRVGLASDG